jgi:hypothetical protein
MGIIGSDVMTTLPLVRREYQVEMPGDSNNSIRSIGAIFGGENAPKRDLASATSPASSALVLLEAPSLARDLFQGLG